MGVVEVVVSVRFVAMGVRVDERLWVLEEEEELQDQQELHRHNQSIATVDLWSLKTIRPSAFSPKQVQIQIQDNVL